jgi:solute carrier family 35 (UDP-sugar transporter), member A1/2/3
LSWSSSAYKPQGNTYFFLFLLNDFHSLSVVTSVSKGINHEKYSSLEVIAASELIKCIVSIILMEKNNQLIPKLIYLTWNGKKVIILVILYSFSNTLPFFAIPRIGAAAFTVCAQLKIVTTALFGTLLLGKVYTFTQWRALLLLILGCILVVSPILTSSSSTDPSSSLSSPKISHTAQLLGLLATLLQATISGFSSVYLESLLKDREDKATIWERNFQLAFYSLFFLGFSVVGQGFVENLIPSTVLSAIREDQHSSPSSTSSSSSHQNLNDPFSSLVTILFSLQLFHGWTSLTLLTVFLMSVGGILVAATLKYADAVLKCFATAVSIAMVSVIGYLYLNETMDIFVMIGMIVTLISILNYTLDHSNTHNSGVTCSSSSSLPLPPSSPSSNQTK